MDWPVAVLVLAGLVLVLGVLMLVRAGPKQPAVVMETTISKPAPQRPRAPYVPLEAQPRQPAGVWEIAQGVFWGLWLFVISGTMLAAIWAAFVYWALGNDSGS